MVCIAATLPQTFRNIGKYNFTWVNGLEKVAARWITENIKEDDKIVSWDAGKVLYYTGRKPCITIKEDTGSYESILDIAIKLDADYLIFNTHRSRRVKKVSSTFVEQGDKHNGTTCYKVNYANSSDNISVYKFPGNINNPTGKS